MNALRELEVSHAEFGPGCAERKLRCLARLARAKLGSARELERAHELALFLRAYPDSPAVLAAASVLLEGFERRGDLRRFAAQLADSGIAGTATRYRFFLPTAARLARAHPAALEVDWDEWDPAQHARLDALLPLLARPLECPALDAGLEGREFLAHARARGEAQGAFLARRFAELDAAPEVRAQLWDELDPPLRLDPCPGAPTRTTAVARGRRPVYQREPLSRTRPDLRRAARVPPLAVRRVRGAAARALVELAQDAMAARARDLDAFMHADARDVRLIDCGGGLGFAMFGVQPEQRLPLESVHAFLTLHNGVPIGYVLASVFLGSAEVAYNVFETWRGAEAAHVYGRVLGMLHALYGADSFEIDPYQLGHENEEGIASGAWWFYQKLGFRPDERGVRALLRRELARLRKHKGARSSPATLRALAREPLYFFLGREREDVLGRFPLERLAQASMRALAEQGGQPGCARRALARLGLRAPPARSAQERRAFERWAPLLCALPGLERWSPAERRAAALCACRKGAQDELEYVRTLQGARSLRRALCALARVRSSV
ncbi:MAG: hypothetical protein IPJ19_00270 [Planctomycetes bacterium]|nr:hypothetical protein [Planctomycetota bacterium]